MSYGYTLAIIYTKTVPVVLQNSTYIPSFTHLYSKYIILPLWSAIIITYYEVSLGFIIPNNISEGLAPMMLELECSVMLVCQKYFVLNNKAAATYLLRPVSLGFPGNNL